MGGAVAKSRRFSLTRIRQALDTAGFTPEQCRKFLNSLNSNPAPKGRPSEERRAKAALEESRELEQRIAEWRANRYSYKKGPLSGKTEDDP